MPHPTLALLADLVAINSVNPSLVPGAPGEQQIARAVEAELRRIGLDVEVQEAAPGRPNVVGILEGRTPGPTLMFCGHLDTVGVEGMVAPFDPLVRDGRLYGRGAQDMKGGVAAMIGAARTIASSGGLASGRLIVAGVADEEYASIGADALVTRWRADGAVVPEPTDLTVAIGHKGFAWVEVIVHGRAAHGSRPREGRDAILRMGRVLARLEALDRVVQNRAPHPLIGTGSLHASRIDGGRELSSYPDRCTLQLERRTVDEPADVAVAEVDAILDELRGEDPEFQAEARPLFARPSYALAADHPLCVALLGVQAQHGRCDSAAGMTFWTDAAILAQAGIPAVLFGPGGAGLHSPDEYVLIEDVLACEHALVELARSFTG